MLPVLDSEGAGTSNDYMASKKVLIYLQHLIFNEQYLVALVVINKDILCVKAHSITRLLQHKIKQTKNGGVLPPVLSKE